jgi:hypothetical protein
MLEKDIKLAVVIAVGVITLGFVVGQYRELTAPTPTDKLVEEMERIRKENK